MPAIVDPVAGMARSYRGRVENGACQIRLGAIHFGPVV